MSDIIERLLTRTDYVDREEAADEITRLRTLLREVMEIAMRNETGPRAAAVLEKKCPTTT